MKEKQAVGPLAPGKWCQLFRPAAVYFPCSLSISRQGAANTSDGRSTMPSLALHSATFSGLFQRSYNSMIRAGFRQFIPVRHGDLRLAGFHPLVAVDQQRLSSSILILAEQDAAEQRFGSKRRLVIGGGLLTNRETLAQQRLGLAPCLRDQQS